MDNTRQRGGGGSKNSVFGRTFFVNGPKGNASYKKAANLSRNPVGQSSVCVVDVNKRYEHF